MLKYFIDRLQLYFWINKRRWAYVKFETESKSESRIALIHDTSTENVMAANVEKVKIVVVGDSGIYWFMLNFSIVWTFIQTPY